MGYHIYTTDGIILKRATFGEANVILHVLTQDLGLIVASAQAARLASSKLRPALQEYAHVSVSCVKGKNGWKITNVIEKENLFFDYPTYSRKVLSQVAFVLLKMIPGESPHKEIFNITKSGLVCLKSVPEENISFFEILIVLRLLHELGYVVSDSKTQIYFKDNSRWDGPLLEEIIQNKKMLVGLINKAFQESHL